MKTLILAYGVQPPRILKGANEEQSEYFKRYESIQIFDDKLYLIEQEPDGKSKRKYIVPKHARQTIMFQMHGTLFSGQLGFHKTHHRIAERFFWPSMKEEILNFVNTC